MDSYSHFGVYNDFDVEEFGEVVGINGWIMTAITVETAEDVPYTYKKIRLYHWVIIVMKIVNSIKMLARKSMF